MRRQLRSRPGGARVWRGPATAGFVFALLFGCRGEGAAPGTGSTPSRSVAASATEPAGVEVSKPAVASSSEPASGLRPDGTLRAEATQMGTQVSITVYVDAEARVAEAKQAIEAAFAEIERVENLMSEWRPASELSRLNASGDRGMVVGRDLFEVLSRAAAVSRETKGLFDVTFYGVGQLWSFKPGAKVPDPRRIASHLGLVGWQKLDLDGATSRVRFQKDGMKIGLGAIAKGYGVDAASTVLKEKGFSSHIVEAGGDLYMSGKKGAASWVVGVQDPDGRGALAAISLVDIAIVTSGNYQRFFEVGGVRYAHILDPRTGWPTPHATSPKSITVVAPKATEADAYATAIAVMGVEAGIAFAERHPQLEAVIIGPDDRLHVTSGLVGRLVMRDEVKARVVPFSP